MSQIYLKASGSEPSIPTSFVTEDGTAVPVANVLNLLAGDTTENNDDGIRSIGSGNTVTYQLTNRVTGTVTTTDATPTQLLSVSLGATPGVFIIEGSLQAYNTTDTAGAAYIYTGAARTTGAVGVEIAQEQKGIYEEAANVDLDFDLTISGNNAVLTVEGLPGKTINWNCLFTYRFVG